MDDDTAILTMCRKRSNATCSRESSTISVSGSSYEKSSNIVCGD